MSKLAARVLRSLAERLDPTPKPPTCTVTVTPWGQNIAPALWRWPDGQNIC